MGYYIEISSFEPDVSIKSIVTETGVFDNLIHDELSIDGLWKWLDNNCKLQIGLNGEFVGFYSMEPRGVVNGRNVVEVHAFILPQHRKHSIPLSKFFAGWIFNNTSFQAIITCTSTVDSRMDRVMRLMGFKFYEEAKDTHTFNGESYDSHCFYQIKE